jgi:hypothetical protein
MRAPMLKIAWLQAISLPAPVEVAMLRWNWNYPCIFKARSRSFLDFIAKVYSSGMEKRRLKKGTLRR